MKEIIRDSAYALGFSHCRFTSADELSEQRIPFQQWIKAGFHAEMQYMENHFEKRMHPAQLEENTAAVISLAHPYYPEQLQNPEAPQVAKYAYGEDYHVVIKEKLNQLLAKIKTLDPTANGRAFTDSAPILERALAVKAGIGWIGRNSLLITPDAGSFLFLAELFISVKLEPDQPFAKNFCGTCRKCIDSCPTGAIVSDGIVDSRKCLSYWTIEHRGDLPETITQIDHNRVFGCDICQDVCPWNSKAKISDEPRFRAHPDLIRFTRDQWSTLSEDEYRRIFRNSAVKRAKYSGIRRNISAVISNSSRF